MSKRFADARRETLETVLKQVSPQEKEVYKQDDSTWRAFVLMEMSVAKVGEALQTRLEAHENLHTRFLESSAYQELTAGAKKTQER